MQLIDTVSALLRLHELEFTNEKTLSEDEKSRRLIEMERCQSELPNEVLHKYNILKKRYRKNAISTMRNGVCEGCFIALPKTLKPLDGDIHMCEHCGRLLVPYEDYTFDNS